MSIRQRLRRSWEPPTDDDSPESKFRRVLVPNSCRVGNATVLFCAALLFVAALCMLFLNNDVNAATTATFDEVRRPVVQNEFDNRQLIVLVIPYRDRRVHYEKLMRHLEKLRTAKENEWDMHIYVIEQFNNDYFRKGWLSNIAFREAAKRFASRNICVVQHDVDFFPNLDFVRYDWCDEPTLVCSEISRYHNRTPYNQYSGGVLTLQLKHWIQINGYSNLIYGWGGEDDELFYRLRANSLIQKNTYSLRKPPSGQGYCESLLDNDHHRGQGANKELQDLLGKKLKLDRGGPTNFTEWAQDGYNTTSYDIINSFVDDYGSTWFQVNYTSDEEWSSNVLQQQQRVTLNRSNSLI